MIVELRDTRATASVEANLFGKSLELPASPELQIVFDPDRYHPIRRDEGRTSFPKHVRRDIIGEINGRKRNALWPSTCIPKVTGWVRNVERLPSSFRLRISDRWFYPDFVAQLDDGSALVIEYKGKWTEGVVDRTEEKRAIGQHWAKVTGGKFAMPFDRITKPWVGSSVRRTDPREFISWGSPPV